MNINPIKTEVDYQATLAEIEQLGLGRGDLEPYIGPRGRVAEILNRTRTLTLPMIRRLHQGLGIPAEILIRESQPAGQERA